MSILNWFCIAVLLQHQQFYLKARLFWSQTIQISKLFLVSSSFDFFFFIGFVNNFAIVKMFTNVSYHSSSPDLVWTDVLTKFPLPSEHFLAILCVIFHQCNFMMATWCCWGWNPNIRLKQKRFLHLYWWDGLFWIHLVWTLCYSWIIHMHFHISNVPKKMCSPLAPTFAKTQFGVTKYEHGNLLYYS